MSLLDTVQKIVSKFFWEKSIRNKKQSILRPGEGKKIVKK